MPPSASLRIQVINRVVAVLQAIVAGADYFYTPYAVVKKYLTESELKGYPTYMVFASTGGNIEIASTNLYDETFMVSIKGWVSDPADTVTKVENAVRDIRRAINEDSKLGTAGSLGALTVEVRIEEPPDTDDGYWSIANLGWFDQRIRVTISGDFGEL